MTSRIPFDRDAVTPFDKGAWPNRLTARVVSREPDARIHGYAVATDLASHYRFSDVVYLSLSGELPTDEQSQTFERALILLAPISIAEAPSHAASLARVCDGSNSAVIGTGAIALAEQARHALGEHRAFLEALRAGSATPTTELETVFALLHSCGLQRDDQLEAVWVVARIAVVSAEGLSTPRASFREYPLNLPSFRYEEP